MFRKMKSGYRIGAAALAAALILACLFSLAGCAKAENTVYTSVEELKSGKNVTVGVITGSCAVEMTEQAIPNARITFYRSSTDMMQALLAGKISAFVLDEPYARVMAARNESLRLLPGDVGPIDLAGCFPKTPAGDALRDEFSAFIREFRSTGKLDAFNEYWMDPYTQKQGPDYASLPALRGTVRLATSPTLEPFSYVQDGQIIGSDIALAYEFCAASGYALEVLSMDVDAMIPSLNGRADMALGMTITEERAKQVNFSEPYLTTAESVMALRSAATVARKSIWQSVADSFEMTFILEQRWKLIARGIGITALISVLSALLGTVLGFGLCLLRRMKNRAVQCVTRIYIRVMQGTPQLVLLLILFYLVFARAEISGWMVAVFAFALNLAAYVCEEIRTGIEAVDKGQMEAALALGFPRGKAFFRIILPQAARHFLPVYRGELISLCKMTSVVGYVAVEDLTKAGEIIRSRTYEAFFPLIVTAVIYFLISVGLTALLSAAERRMDPEHRRKLTKGGESK